MRCGGTRIDPSEGLKVRRSTGPGPWAGMTMLSDSSRPIRCSDILMLSVYTMYSHLASAASSRVAFFPACPCLLCAQLSAQLHEEHDIGVEFPCMFLHVVRSAERTPIRGHSNDSNIQPLIHSRGASWSKFGASNSDSFLRTRSKTSQSQRSRPMRNSTLAGCPRKRV